MTAIWAAGLMSGTSLDGVDAALVQTDGARIAAFGPGLGLPYSPAETATLRAALDHAAAWPDPVPPGVVAEAEAVLHATHTGGLARLPATPRPAVIGFHGQTILHRPDQRLTWQIGDAAALARATDTPVVADFRSQDVAAGGQGAPLVPVFHHALAQWIGATEPLVFLNIGGVANLTWVDPQAPTPSTPGALMAFDTGPGNALINDWMQTRTGVPLDRDGAAAARGRVHAERLASNTAARYLARPGPKSLDRNDFAGVLAAMTGLDIADGAATLTAFTARCVAAAQAHLPRPPARWLVCGGGRLNASLMAALRAALPAPVDPVEAVGLDGDLLEAQAFAHLAVRVLRGLPTSTPGTTGAPEPVCGGRLFLP